MLFCLYMTILNILFLLPLQINSGFLSRNMLQAFKYQARRISFSRRFLSSSSSSAPSDQNGNTIGTTTNESVSDTTKPIIINMKRRMKQRDGTGQPKGYYDDKYILETGLKSGRPPSGKPYLVLGIESSCDDTGASVVRSDGTILSNVIYSQYEIHQKFGGVVPSLAMEAHKSNIDKAVNEAIQQAGLTSVNDVDVIAVTKGPGLEVCLRVGLRKAQALAREFKKTFVTVHHLEAHCMTARLGGVLIKPENHSITGNLTSSIPTESSVTQNPTSSEYDKQTVPKVEFPFLTLLVSGGHTSIVLCNGLGNYTVLGGTLDDALGEAFDKVSRILGLESERSGGAAVEAQAAAYFNRNRHLSLNALKDELSSLNLRLPLLGKPNCDFSYSGLKNAFRMAVGSSRTRSGLQSDSTNAPSKDHQAVETIVSLPQNETELLCAGFQDVAFSHVVDRLRRALWAVDRLNLSSSVSSVVVVGGVASNKELRRRLLTLLEDKYQNDLETIEFKEKRSKQQNRSNDNNSNSSIRQRPKPKKLDLYFPATSLCTDNGAMVAWTAVEKLNLGISDEVEGQEVIPRWPLGRPLVDENLFKKW